MNQTKTVDVLDVKGAKKGQAELPGDLFDVQANVPLMHQVVVAQQAAARQGTHAVKTRGDVRGGGKKPWRQKGTGRARHGSTRSPIWTGGGVTFGPQPHGYSKRTPKKMIQAALRGALSDRAREDRIIVLESLVEAEKPSTKAAMETLAAIGDYTRFLLVLDRNDEIGWLSVRNVPGVHIVAVDQLNAYDVLVSDAVVFTKKSLAEYIAGPAKGKSVKAVAYESELDEETKSALLAAQEEQK